MRRILYAQVHYTGSIERSQKIDEEQVVLTANSDAELSFVDTLK